MQRLPTLRRARPMLGLYALAPEGAHALRIGRTSALLVTPSPLPVADGWREGWCATSVDDGWAAVEVSGADAPQALMQATSADLASGSPSAAVLVFGLRGLSRGHPPASASMWRRRGSRRCSPGSMGSEWGGRARPIAPPGLNKRRRALSSLGENKPERGQCCNFRPPSIAQALLWMEGGPEAAALLRQPIAPAFRGRI